MVADRRALGQWFTAASVAELALAALGPLSPDARIVDPTCGDGAFLAAARARGLRSLTGIEIDAAAADSARARLPGATVLVEDALAPGLPDRLGPFDVVIGNPPYVRAGHIDPAIKRARGATIVADWPELDASLVAKLARLADVAATCLLRSLRLLAPGGRLALVVSTALLDADGAAALWTAVAEIATVEALVVAPAERWFADAAVNSMLVVARRHPAAPHAAPRLLRLGAPTAVAAATSCGLDDLAQHARVRTSPDPATWGAALRAPDAWFAWRDAASSMLVPLGELATIRRGLTTGANDVFYLRREEARARRLETAFLAPVVRSPFNGSPTSIAIAPDESPLVAIALPPDLKLSRVPRIAAWLREHETAALATSARRRDPWWSLPANPARLFLAKAYGPRFVQRLAEIPMLADQRVYALHPRPGVELEPLAAVLNALPTMLALESLGRGSMGYGVVEWTVRDALELPVLDVRRASPAGATRLRATLAALARRPSAHIRDEAHLVDRAALDASALALAPGAEHAAGMWSALLASVALRDRYLLPAVGTLSTSGTFVSGQVPANI